MFYQVSYFNLPDTGPAHLGLQAALDQVLVALAQMPTHRYPNKSENQLGKDVLQSMLNAHVRHVLMEHDWECEVSAYTTRQGQPSPDRCDLGRLLGTHRLLMEVEFGNGASNERNLSKFMCAFRGGELDLAIYIVPTSKMGKRIDSGLTLYETVCRDLEGYPEGHVTCPLVVIGLDIDDNHTVDWSQSGVGNPTLLSATNGQLASLTHFIEQYRDGIVLQDITVPHEPSVQKRLKAVSRRMHSARNKKASAGALPDVEQMQLL